MIGPHRAKSADAGHRQGHMKHRRATGILVLGALMLVTEPLPAVGGQGGVSMQSQHPQEYRRYEGPPVTLQALLQEAINSNPELAALRQQTTVTRQRPVQG